MSESPSFIASGAQFDNVVTWRLLPPSASALVLCTCCRIQIRLRCRRDRGQHLCLCRLTWCVSRSAAPALPCWTWPRARRPHAACQAGYLDRLRDQYFVQKVTHQEGRKTRRNRPAIAMGVAPCRSCRGRRCWMRGGVGPRSGGPGTVPSVAMSARVEDRRPRQIRMLWRYRQPEQRTTISSKRRAPARRSERAYPPARLVVDP